MDPGFPRSIQTDWHGIPRKVDAAFKLHGKLRETLFVNPRILFYVGLGGTTQIEQN